MTARTIAYRVTYASAGCVPEADPCYFDSLAEACERVADEWIDEANDAEEVGNLTSDAENLLTCYPAALGGRIRNLIAEGRVLADPHAGSLYSWSIEELDVFQAFEIVAREAGFSIDGAGNASAPDDDVDLVSGNRTSFALDLTNLVGDDVPMLRLSASEYEHVDLPDGDSDFVLVRSGEELLTLDADVLNDCPMELRNRWCATYPVGDD